MFNFAGLSNEKLEMKNYPDYSAAAEEEEEQKDSDKAASETSE